MSSSHAAAATPGGSCSASARHAPARRVRHGAGRVLHAVIDAQHEELLRWRDAGRLPDASLRVLQRELDHAERTLPVPLA